jgi:acetyltransferase-like isoleucine patch superfamily enzyme
MIKKIIKQIIHRVYLIGKLEDARIQANAVNLSIKENSLTDPTTKIFGNIYNYQSNPQMIIIKDNSMIMGDLCVYKHGGMIEIGSYCFVGPGTRIQSAIKVYIGNNVLIAHNVNIYDHISHPLDSVERHLDYKNFLNNGLADTMNLNEKEIIIEDDVWIGFNCTILKGVKIGKGAIIGANTIITKDIPPYAVIVSKPNNSIIKYTT